MDRPFPVQENDFFMSDLTTAVYTTDPITLLLADLRADRSGNSNQNPEERYTCRRTTPHLFFDLPGK